MTDVTTPDDKQRKGLRSLFRFLRKRSNEAALREAAQVHYETMQAYQEEINRLLDEAEQLRRQMEQLQDRYDALTTPRPATDPG